MPLLPNPMLASGDCGSALRQPGCDANTSRAIKQDRDALGADVANVVAAQAQPRERGVFNQRLRQLVRALGRQPVPAKRQPLPRP